MYIYIYMYQRPEARRRQRLRPRAPRGAGGGGGDPAEGAGGSARLCYHIMSYHSIAYYITLDCILTYMIYQHISYISLDYVLHTNLYDILAGFKAAAGAYAGLLSATRSTAGDAGRAAPIIV